MTALVFSEREQAIALWQGLLDAGIYTNLMVPPSTPAGLNIVRISLSAAHSDDDIGRMIDVLGTLLSRSGRRPDHPRGRQPSSTRWSAPRCASFQRRASLNAAWPAARRRSAPRA